MRECCEHLRFITFDMMLGIFQLFILNKNDVITNNGVRILTRNSAPELGWCRRSVGIYNISDDILGLFNSFKNGIEVPVKPLVI